MCTVGLFDILLLDRVDAVADPTSGPAGPVTLSCDQPDVPCDGRNLVVKVAAAWLAEQRPAAAGGLWAVLHKRIPVGAGLGGGSSDAARAILGLERMGADEREEWRAGRTADDLSAFAARFGSDLPFFLFGPSSACSGRGEVVRPVPPPRPRWAVLVLPPVHMSTADVYRRFDELGLGRERDLTDEPDWPAWAVLGADELLPRLVNDLEPAAFSLRPDVDELRRAAERAAGRIVRMSGSGSSLFTLFDGRAEAEAAARDIGERLGVRTDAVELAPDIDDDLAVRRRA
jgi:4-diphosphocytidyl-2-C-methyl-D-erythritol kinase